MKINCTFTEMRDLVNLVPNPKNYNKHSARQIEMLAKIMNFQGWRHPIIVSKRSGFIVAGHGRLQAAQLLGWDKAPIDLQDFADEATELAFLVADNKIAELAETDHQMLIDISTELGPEFDSELLGLDVDLSIKEIENTSEELNIESFDNFQHQCPKCGFEWNDNGTT
jgi:hypothetical protein